MRPQYASDNALGIPALVLGPLTSTPPAVDAPFAIWASAARRRRLEGTWGFYADDRYFTRLWERPQQVTDTAARAAIEPNYSSLAGMSKAEAIWAIYRKRWLARHWQELDLTIWADLYVAHEHADVAMLGVPYGWQRYATRGAEDRVDELDDELEWARERAAGNPFTLLVYAGGRGVEAWCQERANVVHVPHLRAGVYRPGEGTRRRAALLIGGDQEVKARDEVTGQVGNRRGCLAGERPQNRPEG